MMEKPQPSVIAISRPFWDGCNRGELVYQHCTACGGAQYYPRSLCSHCASQALEWRTSAGRGTVYSYTTVFRAPNEAFQPDTPYVLAVIDLVEGFRVMTGILSPAERVSIGAAVVATFEDRGAHKLLQFEVVG